MTTSNPSSVLSPASSPSTSDAGSTQPPAWELPPGVKVPAAFLENGETLSPPAAAANEQIAQSFEAEIDTTSKAATDGATEISDADWTKAQRRADELYRSLFGDAAYNQQGMHTAIEAKASLTETQ